LNEKPNISKLVGAPLRSDSGNPLFIVDGTECETADPGDVPQPTVTPTVAEVACELCGTKMAPVFLRQHMGAHILSDVDWQQKYGKPRPAFPCGFCGVRPAIGQKLIDAGAAFGCPCWLEKSKYSTKPHHDCKLVGAVSYTLRSASRSSIAAPCTDRPVECQECKAAVWSYSMEKHFAEKHAGKAMPSALSKVIALSYHEKEHTLQLLKNSKVKNVCKGAQCECKKG